MTDCQIALKFKVRQSNEYRSALEGRKISDKVSQAGQDGISSQFQEFKWRQGTDTDTDTEHIQSAVYL